MQAITKCQQVEIPWNRAEDEEGEGPKVGRITVPERMSWLTIQSLHLFVRSRYEELWKMIDELFIFGKTRSSPSLFSAF